jgi:hypothetical protein
MLVTPSDIIDTATKCRVSDMSTRLEVQSAIEQLPKGEIRDLSKWLQEYLDEEWDREIEVDFGAGKLDRLIARAESDIANKNVRNLDEVLDNL